MAQIDPVLGEMLLELHERLIDLRREMGPKMVQRYPILVTRYYALDGMYHTLEEELRCGAYRPTYETFLQPPPEVEDDPGSHGGWHRRIGERRDSEHRPPEPA